MNYFNKGNKNNQVQSQPLVEERNTKKALTIDDIPQELKDQIVQESLEEKNKKIVQELQKIQEKMVVINKEK